MSDDANNISPNDTLNAVLIRNAELEAALREAQKAASRRVAYAELKAAALKQGMIDLDGLKLIDTQSVVLNEAGDLQGVDELISVLKSNKPWLFFPANSSSTAIVPQNLLPKNKNATDMTLKEWRAARAELLRRR